jgi:CDP-glucose 4,6-dehydratase
VLELLAGYLRVGQCLLTEEDAKWCSSWNFGPLPGQDVPVGELVEEFCRVWGDGRWIDASKPGQLHEANILRLSVEKSISELGWRPTWSVAEAVGHTARWYSRFYKEKTPALDLCLEEIEEFQGRVPVKSI